LIVRYIASHFSQETFTLCS